MEKHNWRYMCACDACNQYSPPSVVEEVADFLNIGGDYSTLEVVPADVLSRAWAKTALDDPRSRRLYTLYNAVADVIESPWVLAIFGGCPECGAWWPGPGNCYCQY